MANDILPPNDGRLSSAATITGPLVGHIDNITPLSNECKYSEERPCEKYRQFMDSSRQERTFMIEKLVGKGLSKKKIIFFYTGNLTNSELETFANVIDSIWHPKFLVEHQKVKVMPTRGFCNEILKRSKATYSTLQISLFYVFRVKKVVHEKLYQRIKLQQEQSTSMQTNTQMDDLMCCGRRMFLASLMVASKYLHDKNYHNKAWSKIAGLDIKEINAAEMAFLKLIDYRLYVSKPTFDRWYTQLHGYIQKGYNSNITTKLTTSPTSSPMITFNHQPSGNNNNNNNYHSITNYPSPPPDEETTASTQHPLAPLSPPMNPVTESEDKRTSYRRTDSGVSFDILSPPSSQPTGTKRQFNQDNETNMLDTKRVCQ